MLDNIGFVILLCSLSSKSRISAIDGGKKEKGRKEHIIVDTLGLPMAARVHAANIHGSVGAVDTIKLLQYEFPRLKKT